MQANLINRLCVERGLLGDFLAIRKLEEVVHHEGLHEGGKTKEFMGYKFTSTSHTNALYLIRTKTI